jgi:hypothetical protein
LPSQPQGMELIQSLPHMDLKEVKARVAEIISTDAKDPEAAHGADDRLRAEFLAYVAKGHGGKKLQAIARELLKTNSITRWCA